MLQSLNDGIVPLNIYTMALIAGGTVAWLALLALMVLVMTVGAIAPAFRFIWRSAWELGAIGFMLAALVVISLALAPP